MIKDNWDETYLNIGELRESTSILFHFTYKGDQKIIKINPGCKGCTKIKGWDDNKLKVKYTASNIPKHLKKDYQNINKHITVTYQDGSKEVLRFAGTIKKK